MKGDVCLITGASSGIGRATALGLAKLGMTVVVVARDMERGNTAVADIRRQSGNTAVDLLLADLSEMQQVRDLAATFQTGYGRLDVLINNAGLIPQTRQETANGFEMQFTVNHLAHFLLTQLLIDQLRASAPARIINVSSMTHQWGEIDLNDLQSRRRYEPRAAYAQSKLANVLFTYELARRLAGSGVTANCLHPGVIATRLNADYAGRSRRTDAPAAEAMRGARTSLYLASAPELESVSGKYFVNSAAVRSSDRSYDTELARRLWDESVRLTGEDNI